MRLTTSELIHAAYHAARYLPKASSQLMRDLAERLDTTQAALCESLKIREALAEENAALKAGASYFSYGSEHNFEWHKTAEEAVEAAEAAIDDYRGDACDGWSEEVSSICWGVIMQTSTKVGERPRTEDDCCDPAIDTICDYALLPNIETPDTDVFMDESRAQGVEMYAANLDSAADDAERRGFDDAVKFLQSEASAVRLFAAQLRGNSNGGAL